MIGITSQHLTFQKNILQEICKILFINEGIALRTHTSSVQVRVMENQPPIRTISPGRVYRNEAISARAHCFFHQVEGLYIVSVFHSQI